VTAGPSAAAPRAPGGERPVSAQTAAATAFVEARRRDARDLGARLGDLADDPEAFVAALREGLASLADETYRAEQSRVAPGLDDAIGVRLPLLAELNRGFDRESRWAGADTLLWLAERLLREPGAEIRYLAFDIVARVLPTDPERGWQVLRRAARAAHEWITVDSLAHAYGLGILLDERRWSEIEQLAFSASPWERRLVGSTIATIPFVKHREGRRPEVATHGLEIVGNLVGDDSPDVQKALSWALRSMARVDLTALTAFCETQSVRAANEDDGYRAWVIRDALPALGASDAERIRRRLDGIRRRPGAPATSDAAEAAGRFRGLIDDTPRAGEPRGLNDEPTNLRPDAATPGVTR
jgi:3-methyladenine DNA glycosylase AlkD